MVEETLTKAEAASYVKVSIKTIDRWIGTGLLEAVRLGPRIVRVYKKSLEAVGEPIVAKDKVQFLRNVDVENYAKEQRQKANYGAWHLYNLLEQYVRVVGEYNGWVSQRWTKVPQNCI